MNDPRDLLIWQQGLLEYVDLNSITLEQAKVLLQGIKDHMNLLVTKVTPIRTVPDKQTKTAEELAKDMLEKYKRIPLNPSKWILPNEPTPYWPKSDDGWDKRFFLEPGYEMKPGVLYC